MKVNLQQKLHIQVPSVQTSSDYATTKARFDRILSEKLGVRPSAQAVSTPSREGGGASVDAVYNDVRLKSGATASEIDERLKGTQMAGLGKAFVDAEAKYGINAWFLTGLAAHESAYGSSPIARDKNNLFGYGAYDQTPYTSARTFSSMAAGVEKVAENLSRAYLTEGGSYFNGYGMEAINQRYATDKNWARAIKAHMNRLTEASE